MREAMKKRITDLMATYHVSIGKINKITDGAATRVRNYYDGLQRTINLEDLVALADYFGVPIDYLIGRTDELDEDLFKKAEALHLKSYETYLCSKHHEPSMILQASGNSTPYPVYPYNLIKTFKLPLEVPLADQVKKNLEDVIDTRLTKREAICVRKYFGEYKTLEEVGEEFDVTRERIRQIIAKAGRKLRHPSTYIFITRGLDYQDRLNEEYERRLNELIEKEARKKVDLHKALVKETYGSEGTIDKDIPIESLNFSVRTFNCLRRKNVHTVADLEALSLTDILNIRNLGKKSFNEILDKVPSLAERKEKYEWETNGKVV